MRKLLHRHSFMSSPAELPVETEPDRPLVDFRVADVINEMDAACADAGWFLKTMQRNNQTMASWWSGKDYTGKKSNAPGRDAKPFNGASDSDAFLAKTVIRKRNAMRVAGLARGALQVTPTGSDDARKAGLMRQVLRYFLNGPMKSEVLTQGVRAGSYADRYRCSLLYVGWKEERGVEPVRFTAAEIAGAMQQMDAQFLTAEQDGMVLQEEPQTDYLAVVQTGPADDIAKLMVQMQPGLAARGAEGLKQAKRALAQLRRGEPEGVAYASYVKRSSPIWEALQPFVDVFFPAEAFMEDGLESCRWIARVQWRSAQWIKEQAAIHGWDAKWVTEVLANHKGRSRMLAKRLISTPWALTTLGVGWGAKINSETHQHLYEIIELWDRSMTSDGLTGTYRTVLHADVGEMVAKRELRADWDGMYPFVPFKFDLDEKMLLAGDSLPELTQTAQQDIKAQLDARKDVASMTTYPVWTGDPELANLRPSPGQFLPALRGKLPEVLKLNPPDGRSVEIERAVRDSIDEMFGFESTRLGSAQSMTMQQAEMDWFMSSISQAVARTARLIQQYMAPLRSARIAGTNELVTATAEEVRGGFDFASSFNVMSTDVKWVKEHLGMIKDTVLALDNRGYINTLPILEAGLNMIDPQLAERSLPKTNDDAQQQSVDTANAALADIFTGGAPMVKEGMDFGGIAQAMTDEINRSPLRQQSIIGGTQVYAALTAYMSSLVNNDVQHGGENARVGKTLMEDPLRQPKPAEQLLAMLEQLPPGVSLYQLLNQSPAAPMQPQQEQQMAV
jgi:hypothetical protein